MAAKLRAQPRNYCHACGSRYLANVLARGPEHERPCRACGTITWANATPVAVMLQPVYWLHDKQLQSGRWEQRTQVGILIGRRGIEPNAGSWCLPGGFSDWADPSYEAGAGREVAEEIALDQPLPYADYPPRLWKSLPGDPGQIIAFSQSTFAIPIHWLLGFKPCRECPAVSVAFGPQELCFPSHTQALSDWFSTQALPRLKYVEWQRAELILEAERTERYANCHHQWTGADDLFNPHTNTEYQRCQLCGKKV